MGVRLLADYDGGTTTSREIIWFGRRGNAYVSGNLNGGSAKLYWRPSENRPDVEVKTIMAGDNDFEAGHGLLFARFTQSGNNLATKLNIDVQDRRLGD